MFKFALANPIRTLVIGGLIGVMGVYAGLSLPISLYPQTSKPEVSLNIPYGGYSAREFIRKYGATIEYDLENIKNSGYGIDKVQAYYGPVSVNYQVSYDWNVPFTQALKEVKNVAASAKGMLPRESADGIGVWQRNRNAGFLAISFYGKKESPNELYDILDPILTSELKKVEDAESAMLWNPSAQEVNIRLYPEKLAFYGLLPKDVYNSLYYALPSYTGGEINLGRENIRIQVPSNLLSEKAVQEHLVDVYQGKKVFLRDIAEVELGRSITRTRVFRTNGQESLILFANPKSGANVKRMSEDIIELVESSRAKFPPGIQYRVLVDPSEFIRDSIKNLIKDVVIAALLAVFVLYLFIGSFRSVVTAAIEIPLSMLIAFIIMRLTGMNLNLISLGGLALAAGMNVDASVVVMENIFSNREKWYKTNQGSMSFIDKFDLVLSSVKEVAIPIFLSITTTLIVFIPLAMTTDLTSAVLGDLAKAVIYSHGISGLVATLIVPIFRLKLMKASPEKAKAPVDGILSKFETLYLSLLERGIKVKGIKVICVIAPLAFVSLLGFLITPNLKKEIVGTPDTDWIYMSISSPGVSSARELENIQQKTQAEAIDLVGDKVQYTFSQLNGKNYSSVMLRLKDKRDMDRVVKTLQKQFTNTPDIFYYVDSWNPAELPLPEMHHFELEIIGQKPTEIAKTLSRTSYFLNELGDYERLQKKPSNPNQKILQFIPDKNLTHSLDIPSLLEITSYSSGGKTVGSAMIDGKLTPLTISFSDERFQNPEVFGSYPIKAYNKVLPLSALGHFKIKETTNQIYREDGREKGVITAKLDKENEGKWEELYRKYQGLIEESKGKLTEGKTQIELITPQKELFKALDQIKTSLFVSLILVVLVLWLQFQSLKSVGIILLTIPLGVMGALISLYVFKSSLSLNSALGIILLNGIAVNNAILMVEVYQRLIAKGLSALDAIRETCRSRLRPILITSFTTMLGMFPIAMGWGDGGKILQPLGIVVCFGLFFSTSFSLLIVPWVLVDRTESGVFFQEIYQKLLSKKSSFKGKRTSEEVSWQ